MHHLYAEDSQLYMSFTSDDSANQLDSLKSYLDSVWNWMRHTRLKLNSSKTDFLLIGDEQERKKCFSRFPITIMVTNVNPSASARNLGVVFDLNFNFWKHISQVFSSCFNHIRDLRRIRRHLNLDNAKSLACALVTGRLYYYSSVLQGVAGKNLEKSQRAQNTLARVVAGSRPFAHAAPLLRSFHWLKFLSNLE